MKNKVTNFNLDMHAYEDRALVLKTNDFFEVLAFANLASGTICILHTSRTVKHWEALNETK